MRVTVTPGVDAVAWSRLAARAPQHDPGWLSVMATRLPGEVYTVTAGDRLGFCAVLVSDPEAYEAYNPYAVLWRDPPVFAVPDVHRRGRTLSTMDTDSGRTLPALVLVAPGYVGDPAGTGAGEVAEVTACLRAVLDWCAARGLAGLHVMYAADPVVRDAVHALGGCGYPITTRWVLPVWWDDWDGYLLGLPPARPRKITTELRRSGEAGVACRELDPVADAESILNGRCDLLRWYGQSADRDAERRRLRALAEVFGDRLLVYGAEQGGEVVCSAVCLREGRRVSVVYTGTTDRGRTLPFVHFAAVFYTPVLRLTRADVDEIDYGIGHDESKALRGCVPRPLSGYAIGVTPEHQRALDTAARLLEGVSVVGAGA